jgi:hypothetical protein
LTLEIISWIPYHVIPVGSIAAAYECHAYQRPQIGYFREVKA